MDKLNDFILETFGGKRSLLDQLNDEIKTIDGLTKTVERINKGLTEHLDMESKVLLRWIDKCAALEDKIKLYDQALMVACEETENLLKDRGVKACVICWFTEPTRDCDEDCGSCLKAYFLKRGQDNIDMENNNQEAI